MKSISLEFPISNEEYLELDEKFGRLTWHAAHELKKKNSLNNYTDDPEDIKQSLTLDMLKAGSYYKRQIYIEKCFSAIKQFVKDPFLKNIMVELIDLWQNRTRHGANRQKFGPFQEMLLSKLLKIVPKSERPDKNERLKIDTKFTTYCKAIVWNGQKSLGKKITREKSVRNGVVSLSEFDHLL